MAKRTLDELLASVNAIVGEDNTSNAVISLIEDLTDTLTEEAPADPGEDQSAEIERLKAELEAQKKKYKDRFYGKDDETEEEIETEDEKPDGLTITTKDIFKDKKED